MSTPGKNLQTEGNEAKLRKGHQIVQLMVVCWGFLLVIVLAYCFMASTPEITEKVFFDIEIDDKPVGRIVIGLFGKVTPKTARNFLYSANGKAKFSYQGTNFSRAIKNFMIQGGEIIPQGRNSATTIYGKEFDDENFKIQHSKGCVSMANMKRKNSNGSEFFILTRDSAPWLDGSHVVFGRVLQGMDIVTQIEKLPTSTAYDLLTKVVIAKCGEIQ